MKTVILEAAVDTTDTPARDPGEFILLIVKKMTDEQSNPLPGKPEVITMTVYNDEIFKGARKAKVTIELE